jgi:hypothetical protein
MPSSRDFEWDYAKAITPNDSTDLTKPWPIGLHVSATGGVVKVDFARAQDDGDGTISTVTASPYIEQGDYVKMKVRRVYSTGTAAGTILGLYRSTKSSV